MSRTSKDFNTLGACRNCNEFKFVSYFSSTDDFECQVCHSRRLKSNVEKIYCSCGRFDYVYTRQNGKTFCNYCYKTQILRKIICCKCGKEKTLHKTVENFQYCTVCYNSDYVSNRKRNDSKFDVIMRLRYNLTKAFKQYSKKGKIKKSREYGIDYQAIFEHLGPCPGLHELYHIDHIKPLHLFNFDDPEQVKLAFAPENHQWLIIEENLKKGGKYIEPVSQEEKQNA